MDINKSKVVAYPGSGNGVAAASDFEAGDAIIEIANPYIVVVERASLDKVCSQCLLEMKDLKKCSKCKVARYCSTACQTEAWNSIHKLECPVLRKMPDVPPTPVRALMQVLLTHKFGKAPDPRWKDLKSNQQTFAKTPRWPDIILQAKAASQFAKFPNDSTSLEVAVGALCRMSTNAFRAMSDSNEPIGLCFEPVLALANHSCTPNAAVVFDGRKVMLRALDSIKKDSQIFISYIDATSGLPTRQKELKEAYFFNCTCEKCSQDDTPYQSFLKSPPRLSNTKLSLLLNPRKLANTAKITTTKNATMVIKHAPFQLYASVQAQLNVAKTIPDEVTKLQFLTECLVRLRPFRDLELFAQPPFPAVLHELYLHYLDIDSYPSAVVLLLFMQLNCYAFSHPQPTDPSNVVRLLTIAQLCLSIPSLRYENTSVTEKLGGEAKEAFEDVDWISAAQVLLILVANLAPLSHGNESRFVEKIRKKLGEVEEVQRMRGTAGEALKIWGERESVEGKVYAEKVCESLRRLGGMGAAGEVMDWGLDLVDVGEQMRMMAISAR